MEIKHENKSNLYDNVEIMCPYCFEKFYHSEVGFRAKAIPKDTIKEWEEKRRQMILSDDAEGAKNYEKKLALAEKFSPKKDEVLLDYWKNMGWAENSELYEIGDGYSEYHEANDDAIAIGYIEDPIVGLDTASLISDKQVDGDGFVIAATDIRGEVTEKRVCPHCHNKLPKLYGKNPVKFMAVVGVSGAGKTVMLSKLLEKMGVLVDNVSLRATTVKNYTADRYVKKYRIEQNAAMPEGTNRTQFKPPIFVNLVGSGAMGSMNTTTLVIYDIAGENCVDPERINTIGPFVRNANGIIMLLDPEQVPSWEMPNKEGGDGAVLEPETVINTMANAFLCDQNHTTDVPLAVVFSKSDQLRKATVNGCSVVQENSHIFKNIDYTRTKRDAFLIDEFKHIDGEVKILLQRYSRPFYGTVSTLFNRFGCMAVSTLGNDTEKHVDTEGRVVQVLRTNIEHTRLEEPLLWLLYQWGVVKGHTENEKKKGIFARLIGG